MTRFCFAAAIASLALTVATPVYAQPVLAQAGATETPAAVSDDEAIALRLAAERGLRLYQYDQAAWHTTDAMLEDLRDPGAAGVQGWVVTEVDGGWNVTYVTATDDDGFEGVYSARYDGENVDQRRVLRGADRTLSAEQLARAKAFRAIPLDDVRRCIDRNFNLVVMPAGDATDALLVYLLTPQVAAGAYPIGGHYRFTVLAGVTTSQRRFTNSCLTIGVQEGESPAEALVVSHLLDPVPTEIHVFSVYASGLPVYVQTISNETLWAVEVSGGQPRIRLADMD